MKRLLLSLSLFVIIMTSTLTFTACSPTGTKVIIIDWVDFFKFNDITYIHHFNNIPVDESRLSPYGEIKFKVADNINDQNYKSNNGDAAYLETGTPIYSIQGYSSKFRLVAVKDQKQIIYEADTNPDAKTGAYLLDIEDKVTAIKINSKVDGTTEMASITDAQQVSKLVQMVLNAPVDQTKSRQGSDQYFLEFHLIDKTVVQRSYLLDTGILSHGIQLPKEFGEIIKSTLDKTPANETKTAP